MSRLGLKLLRDLLASKWQFLAISFVAALGVAMFQGAMLSYENQKASYQLSYDKLAFGDVWVPMRRAPRAVVPGLARIPGVTAIEGRISEVVEVEQTGGRRPRVIGRLITIPTNREPSVNRLRLIEGRPLGSQSRREVLLEVAFAQANHYRPGDRIYPKYLGKRPALILADEPTGSLDYETGIRVLEVMQAVTREMGRSIFLVTHNSEITKMADRVVRIRSGKIAEVYANPDPLTPKELRW